MQACKRLVACCFLGLTLLSSPVPAQTAGTTSIAAPKIDKQALTSYLRYAEGFTPSVSVTIDDPKPSIFTGFYEVLVRLRANKNEAVRTYYLTRDGKRLFAAPIFDLDKSPFIANLENLKEDGAPAFGPADAAVKIYVFSDFECPYCQEEAKVLRQGIDKQHANQVRVIFKNFPLESIHPWARTAALAGVCIARQNIGKFWSFHDWIYQHQTEISPANFRDKVLDFTKAQALSTPQLSSCIDSSSAAEQVNKTVAEGRNLGIVQTPTLFVNGRMVAGALPAQQVNLLIQIEFDHQRQQSALATKGAAKCCETPIPTITGK